MKTETPLLKKTRWTAAELRRLPLDQRNAVLASAAEQAEVEYLTNSELNSFEAFGQDDLHGDSANTKTK